MNEQIPTKNILEEMKKDLKSLLGIKRNKDPVSIEKVSTSENKKDELIKSEENSENYKINKLNEQIKFTKKRNDLIDLTLDENENINMNIPINDNLNFEISNENISTSKNIDKGENTINGINLIDMNKDYFECNKHTPEVSEEINNKCNPSKIKEEDYTINTNISDSNNIIINEKKKNKDFLSNSENELNLKKEVNVYFNKESENKVISLSNNKDDNKHEDKENQINILSDNKSTEFEKDTSIDNNQKNNSQDAFRPSIAGFNIFNIQNLSFPQKDLLNLFQEPEKKNIFENVNKNQISFMSKINTITTNYTNKPLESIVVKQVEKDHQIHKESKEEEEPKKSIKEEIKKEDEIKTIHRNKTGFSFEMVTGLNTQKDQIIRLFGDQTVANNLNLNSDENIKNKFGGIFNSINETNTLFDMKKAASQFNVNSAYKEINSEKEKEKNEVSKIEKILDLNEDKKLKEINKNLEVSVIPHRDKSEEIDSSKQIQIISKNENKDEIERKENLDKQIIENKMIINLEIKDNNNYNNNNNNDNTQKQSKENFEKKNILSNKINNVLERKLEQVKNDNDNGDNNKNKEISVQDIIDPKTIENSLEPNNAGKENLSATFNLLTINKPITSKEENRDQLVKKEINNLINENNKKTEIVNSNSSLSNNIQEEQKNLTPKIVPINNNKTLVDNKSDNTTHANLINVINENKKEVIQTDSNQMQIDEGNKKIKISTDKNNISTIEPKNNIKSNEELNKDSSKIASSISKDQNAILEPNKINTNNNTNNINSNKIEIIKQNEQPIAQKPPIPTEQGKKRAISFQEAKEQIDKFSDMINNLEIEMKEKYGINIPQLYYEDLLPENVKLKLVEEYFNDKEIIELGKQLKKD